MTDDVTYSESDEAQTYVVMDTLDTEDAARARATQLVEHGIGAVVQAVTLEGHEEPDAAATGDAEVSAPPEVIYEVRVMAEQATRAYEVLGYEVPGGVPEPPDKTSPPWKTILIIWAVAMVVIPVTAGYLTYLLLSRGP